MYYTHLQDRVDRLQYGHRVTYDDWQIRQRKELVVEWEEKIKQHQQRLLEMEQEEGWSYSVGWTSVLKLSERHFVHCYSGVCRAHYSMYM